MISKIPKALLIDNIVLVMIQLHELINTDELDEKTRTFIGDFFKETIPALEILNRLVKIAANDDEEQNQIQHDYRIYLKKRRTPEKLNENEFETLLKKFNLGISGDA